MQCPCCHQSLPWIKKQDTWLVYHEVEARGNTNCFIVERDISTEDLANSLRDLLREKYPGMKWSFYVASCSQYETWKPQKWESGSYKQWHLYEHPNVVDLNVWRLVGDKWLPK